MVNDYFQAKFYSREWATLNRRYLVGNNIQNNTVNGCFEVKLYSRKLVTLNRRYLIGNNIQNNMANDYL